MKRKVISWIIPSLNFVQILKGISFNYLFLPSLFLILSIVCPAQLPHELNHTRRTELYFRQLTRDDGLPSNNIRWIISDFQDYIWIATDNGLVKYDGSEMIIYQYIPGKANWIMESAVTTIYQSRDSMLWIGTKNGISVFDPFSESFTNYQYYPNDPESFPCDWVLNIYEDSQGIIWIGTNQGLVRWDTSEEVFRLFKLHSSDQPTERENLFRWVNRIVDDPRDPDMLLLATRGGLLLFDKEKGLIAKDYDKSQDHLYRCEALSLDGRSILWTGEWDTGLKQFDLTSESWEVFNPTGKPMLNILGIMPADDHKLWLGTVGNGLVVFDRKSHTFEHYLHQPQEPHSVISNWIQSDFHKDNSGMIWIATDQGISVSDPYFKSFTYYKPPLPMVTALDFLRDKETALFYLAGARVMGLFIWDESNKRWQTAAPINGNPKRISIHRIIKDRKGVIWTTTDQGLYFLNEKKLALMPYMDKKGNSLPMKDTVLIGLMEDTRGYLWIGSRFDGVFRLDPSREIFTHFGHMPHDPHSLPDSREYVAIHEDAQNHIWFGHYNGVTLYDPFLDRFLHHINDSLVHRGIRQGVIWGIASDTLDRVYLCIEKEGLLRIETQSTGKMDFKLFHLGHGLSDLNLFDIARDPNGDLWMINEGVTHFNPYEETFRVFDDRNGLHGNKSWGDNVYVDEDGNLFLTSDGGYETRNIHKLDIRPGITRLLFEPLEINGTIIPEGLKARFTSNFSLSANQNNLVFHYKAISYYDPDQVKYDYMLEGYDESWNHAGSGTEARYTNLPPGRYIFRLKASHRGGRYPDVKEMSFVIPPYFWQTNWFIILAAIGIAGLLIIFYLFRVRQIRKKERLMTEFQKKLAESEMQALRAQMNPHFIFNSLNSINNFILKNETEAASDFLTKFSRLVRQVLNNSKNKLVSLEDELTALRLYLELEQLRFANRFSFEIHKDRRIDAQNAMVPPLFIQPYVENAIWHGLMHKEGDGHIAISVEMPEEGLQFIIEDDGIGRVKAAEYKSKFGVKKQSMGMQITRNRITLLNEMYDIRTDLKVLDLQHPDGSAAGTRVVVNIPFINQNLIRS